MLLETGLVSIVCNVISQIISQQLTRRWQRYDKQAIEQIIQTYLTTHRLPTQTSTVERQISFIFRGMQWVDASRNLNPLPGTLPSRVKDIGKVYAIVSIVSEKALDVRDWSKDDGGLIQQW